MSNTSLTSGEFLYPPSVPSDLTFNYLDTINVTWLVHEPTPPGPWQLHLNLDSSGTFTQLSTPGMPTNGSYSLPLHFAGVSTTTTAQLSLGRNGSYPLYSNSFTIVHNDNVAPKEWSLGQLPLSVNSSITSSITTPVLSVSAPTATLLSTYTAQVVETNTPKPSEIAGLVLGAVLGFLVVVFLCAILAVQIRKVRILSRQGDSVEIKHTGNTHDQVSSQPSTYDFYAKEVDSRLDRSIKELEATRNEADGREILQVE